MMARSNPLRQKPNRVAQIDPLVSALVEKVSQVTVPRWIGQSKVYYILPRNFEGGLIFDSSPSRRGLNPNLNGALRTLNVYAGRNR
jgi:hypothetical protein